MTARGRFNSIAMIGDGREKCVPKPVNDGLPTAENWRAQFVRMSKQFGAASRETPPQTRSTNLPVRRLAPWQRERLRRLAARRVRRQRQTAHEQRAQNAIFHSEAVALAQSQRSLPAPRYERGRWVAPWGAELRETRLLAPSDLSLGGSYEDTMSFVEELRRVVFVARRAQGPLQPGGRRGRFLADLTPIDRLSIDGALVVAAEFDRIRRHRKFKPQIDDRRWQPWLRDALAHLGFYEIIDADPPGDVAPDDAEPLRLVKLASGEQVEPQQADDLLTRLQKAAGDAPDRQELYAGLIEAIGNVREHAYKGCVSTGLVPAIPMWWACGAYEPVAGRLHLCVYDQGLGIPTTLPSNEWFSALSRKLGFSSDADQIEAALEYGRSSAADLGGRGNGLWRMVRLVLDRPDSSVHIWSGRGLVSCYSGGVPLAKRQLPAKFCGTLVHWNISMPQGESNDRD